MLSDFFPFSLFNRNVKIKHGPVTIIFPRLRDLNRHTAFILLPRLRGVLYRLAHHRISGRMKIIIRMRPVGLVMEIRLPGNRRRFHPYNTIDDCLRILADWIHINPEFIQ